MNTLITGSSGFIGSHLKDAVPTAHSIDVKPSRWTTQVRDVRCIIMEPPLLLGYADYDVIYHMAAKTDMDWCEKNFQEAWQHNVVGTSIITKFCGNALVIYPSSFGVTNPIGGYFETKRAAENIVREHDPHIIFRFPNPYGPRCRPDSVITRFIKENPITIYGNGEQTRDFVYVDDLIQIMKNYDRLEKNKTYDIGSGLPTTINQLILIIEEVTGEKKHIIYEKPRPFDVKHPPIKSDLDCHTPLIEGIRKTVENMRRVEAAVHYGREKKVGH